MERIYEQHQHAIFKYLFYLIGHEQVAEDLLQETFIRAFRSKERLRNEEATRNWLRKIARNLAYDYLRRKRIIQWLPFIKERHEQTTNSALQFVEQSEQTTALYEALQKLRVEYRDVCILRKIEGCSIEETAHILGWNVHKVKNTQKQALKEMRQLLGGMFDE